MSTFSFWSDELSKQNHSEHPLSDRPFDLLAVDGIDIDIVMTVDRLPGHGEKVMGQFVGRLPGGTVANYACAAARLGLSVSSLSTVGDDEAGQMIIEDFESYGVVTEHVHIKPGVESHFTVILVEPSGERSIIVVPMYEQRYDDATLQSALSQVRAVHTMPNDVDAFVQMAELARVNDVLVAIDVEATIGADKTTLKRILSYVDVACFNDRGLITITGEDATVAGARTILKYGPKTVVVTLGKQGAIAVTNEESAQVPGLRVQAVDTTGAGDTFNAAFMTGTLRQYPLKHRLAFANAAAALSVTGMGPRGNLPTTTEVEEILASSDMRMQQ